MIALIDIGIGNINSVAKALEYLGLDYKVVKDGVGIVDCTKIIFPGVGHFSVASEKLKRCGLKNALRDSVLKDKKPFLGICLGMQLIAKTSEEGGCAPGLALIGATVKKIPLVNNIKIPHMGWNNVCHDSLGLFKNIEADADFYFVHSFRMEVDDSSARCYFTEYGEKIVAYIEKENIYGTQFHPEKSQGDGLKVLRNFGALC